MLGDSLYGNLSTYIRIEEKLIIDLDNQLKTELFENACKQVGQSKQINMRDGYDHSYFFILSFIDEHIQHASKAIKARMMNQ